MIRYINFIDVYKRQDKGKLILLITCNYDIMSPYVFSGSARANSLKFWNNRGDLTCQNIFWPERTKGIYR